MSIQNNFPAIKPTLLLDFANTKELDSRVTFTRASTATYFDQFGVMQTAASGVARFDHNPTTFESLGLLIEESRTNLLTYSEQFDNAAWTKVSSSITANAIVAPDGTLTGDKLVEDTTASASHVVRPATASVTSGTTYTSSIFAKAGERTQFQIGFGTENSAFAAAIVQFTLTGSGAATAISGSPTFSIAPVGNGWYRCTATATATATASAFIRNYLVSGTNVYTGDGYSGIYIWGAQLEVGSFATSYIPTVASQVTRATDAASMTGTNFSSWYNQDQGTIYAEGFLSNPAVTGSQIRRLAEVSDGSINNRISFGYAASSGTLRSQYVASGVSLNGTNGQTASSVFPSAKVAVAYKVADYAFSPNGASATTSTAANVPVVNTLSIGNEASNSALGSANGTIRKIAYYPIRVTNAQLQTLTS